MRYYKNQLGIMCVNLPRIVFSGEHIFSLSGSVNTQNVRILGAKRPIEGRQAFSLSSSIMVWYAISKGKDVGTFLFKHENKIPKTTETWRIIIPSLSSFFKRRLYLSLVRSFFVLLPQC